MIFCSLVIVGVLSKRRGRALRTPTTPRPASASASAMTPTVRLSLNYCNVVGHVGHGGVVPHVSGTAHRTVDAIVGHQPLELLARVLAAPVGVMQQRIRAPAPPDRH